MSTGWELSVISDIVSVLSRHTSKQQITADHLTYKIHSADKNIVYFV